MEVHWRLDGSALEWHCSTLEVGMVVHWRLDGSALEGGMVVYWGLA